ncbi:LacI family DNA-binding transcriptional regulator [Sulfitobacter geojensis]|uniref:LacI family DNA-binding transcriptional regulator n=1 Tax=Sulfitobacter geojensis TaxID=1342299 RepID=A0AAE2VZQ3_9RHOB|nr:LacI family DNA-binding transcriptional regulator [Sulfitobacter geojensis]MBM1693577.1 LacI family DNA-binding transcriptional regulator [Sulfitobacter geojensis]MBM1705743.1 LacI family DNA-binding transcriptional regulator [Sulfitobacter geojensis]MBM1709801.1 LacI family DNA-binding transcriptional regulator [Sulfitobacter geojensis]MBM1713867.1 LacI family DNA-binding transcriptional regulator [Sulfitobacter geojensis]
MARVTIKSIAKDLGISHMTVSRALSNNPNVLKETRDAVQNRARELGYVKNAAAMAMRGDGAKIVGLILPNIVNEFYARFANAMALACDAQPLQLVIHLTNDNLETEEQALERLREIQASCVVMVPAPGQANSKADHQGSMRIIELIRRRDSPTPNPAILVEDSPAIGAAVAHLAKAGHSRIAYIGADKSLSSGRGRLAAFLGAIREVGLEAPGTLIRTGTPSFEMGRKNASDILASGSATALVCGGFEISNGALSAFMDHTGSDGSKPAFVGYGDPSFYKWVNGGVTTIRVPVVHLVECALTLISAPTPLETVLEQSFPAELVLR